MLVELNKTVFKARLSRIIDNWNNASADGDYATIADCDALFLASGDPGAEDEPMKKGTCFQQWLLGYEFPSTFILFEKDQISILCSASKAKYLTQIRESTGSMPVKIFAQAKGKDAANDALPKFAERYLAHKRVGTMAKETYTGKTVKEWADILNAASNRPEFVDMSPAVSSFLAVKDAEELKATQTASSLTSTLLKHYVAPKLEVILDRETKITHDTFAAQIESRLGSGDGDNAKGPDMKVWDHCKGKKLTDADWQVVEFSYSPIIISKSTKSGYDLRYTGESSEDHISHKGVLLVSLGIRFKSYSSNVSRTFIVDPTPSQEEQYTLLLSLQTEMVSFIKDGVSARDVYQHALSYVAEKNPELEKHFVKNCGFGTGVEFRDSSYLISPKNSRTIHKDMVIILSLGFTDLTEANGAKYAMHLADTIQVGDVSSALLTDSVKSPKDALFFLDAGSEDAKPKKPQRKVPGLPKTNGSPKKVVVAGKVLRNQMRRNRDDENQDTLAVMREHQKELHDRLQQDGLAKFSEDGGSTNGKEGKGWKKFQSYKGEAGLPPEVERLRIYVDRKSQSVVLPIHGFAVPFHVNTIKNASKNDEGEFTYLRINFQTPGQLVGKKEDTPFEDPDATFIRSVSYRSPDGHRFDSVHKQIQELKKEATKREQQKKEMADVIDQDNLVELKGRRPIRMSESFIRPALDGKRLPGEVEIHQNGIRYQSPVSSQRVDILFSNIKHLFYQSSDHELVVILHLHLKAPIMIGKKKASDVQFFREASDVQFDETGNRKRKHRYGDEDEIEMEQQERKRRAMLNNEVQAFGKKISDAASSSLGETVELDSPIRALSFEGVPFRTGVRLQPTIECLVHLTDPPFLVVTLSEIEIASLERVQYGLKHFDMILIFKDFNKTPLHINSIATSQMDDVKRWLDSVELPIAESPVNLNWGPIMKHINESPYEFFQGGGWTFLRTVEGVGSDESDDEQSESDFAADGDDFDDEDDDITSGSDFSDASDDASASDSDASGSGGDDWDELERKAARSDMKRTEGGNKNDGSDSDRPKKKSNGKSNGKSKSQSNGKVKGKR